MAKYKIEDAVGNTNIAEDLDQWSLDQLGGELYEEVEEDEMSRQEWLEDQDEWLKLAAQVRDVKTYPWQGASNVKYPLMTVASLQFHARALPTLINNQRPVKARVVGRDPDGLKMKRANRVSKYMSYQVLEEMTEWVDEMDRMMLVLPIIGMCYKKTYYSENMGRIRSVLVMPRDLILNYHAQDYERARMSHVMYMDQNELYEMQAAGLFLDIELMPVSKKVEGVRDETIGLSDVADQDDQPYEIIETHGWFDLDGDGYREPYIITWHRDSRKILRIVARWDEDGIFFNEKGKVAKIVATKYFTPFLFMPDPNSAVYGIGFGRLLGPTNETVNTLINQLVDAGTLSNMQSGYISRALHLKGGSERFRPGEWKIVNASGGDIKNGIVPLPVREASGVLFNLLGLLIDAGQNITSVSDIMMGENPGQNQPATTSMAVLEQGQKVFNGIYNRIHRALAKEYKLIYKLDQLYLDEELYDSILDEGDFQPPIPPGTPPEQAQAIAAEFAGQPAASIDDFNAEGIDIIPASNPNFVSDMQKEAKANSLLQKATAGLPINIAVATKRSLEAEGHEDVDQLMTLPPQPPSPDELNYQLDVVKTQIDAFSAYFKSIESVAKAEAAEEGQQLNTYRAIVDDKLKVMGLEGQQQGGQTSQQVQPGGQSQARP